MSERSRGPLLALRILSAILLAVAGGIHLYLLTVGVGGLLGVLFVLNGIAGLVLAIGELVTRGALLRITTVLGLLFLIASLAALLLALTVGLFGIREVWSFTLVPETVIVESIGIVVLAITTAAVLRRPRGLQTAAG
ncbi:hypothetical protein [Leifsonia sp. C5G2]|uniref:hypothetical protein n=1 Tax=Leifsonia sp. C5G2 TaxID=2735269 RepID=UPI0015846025|nr:hypothetical protein [Leifsonia sp. C5G2]NUU05086.1 hypothetical protein [Leifsonia sp. C5G2]